MGLSGLFLLRLFTQKEGEAEKEQPVAAIPGSVKPVIFFLGTMALATLGFSHLGFPLTSFLVMLALLKVLGEKRWIYSILLSFITTVASFFLFVQWLKIPLPKGWLGL
jgi:energy-coupling factor transporter transmembrane protein EcfT